MAYVTWRITHVALPPKPNPDEPEPNKGKRTQRRKDAKTPGKDIKNFAPLRFFLSNVQEVHMKGTDTD